jgi:hypothetical protein
MIIPTHKTEGGYDRYQSLVPIALNKNINHESKKN